MNKQADVWNNLRAFMEHGLQEMIEGFRDPSLEYLIQHQVFYHQETDSLREHHYGFDEFPYEYCTIRYFSDELVKRLNAIKAEVEGYIGEVRVNKKIKEPGRKLIFSGLLNGLQEIQENSKGNEVVRMYDQQLDNFFAALKEQIAPVANKRVSLSFKYRQSENDTLERIYHMDIKGISFIDKAETRWDAFQAILTSKNVYEINPTYKIQFQCNTRMAAYMLRQMEWHFENLNFTNIVASERFYSERSTLLTGSNLNVSLTRGGKPIPHHEQINQFFASLQKQ